ncbi:hypothetical protein HYQ46_009195 [Verticillium longisporum]|nr:hypothetical protein HYQ46_009195 [Verticillium longisporum]
MPSSTLNYSWLYILRGKMRADRERICRAAVDVIRLLQSAHLLQQEVEHEALGRGVGRHLAFLKGFLQCLDVVAPNGVIEVVEEGLGQRQHGFRRGSTQRPSRAVRPGIIKGQGLGL